MGPPSQDQKTRARGSSDGSIHIKRLPTIEGGKANLFLRFAQEKQNHSLDPNAEVRRRKKPSIIRHYPCREKRERRSAGGVCTWTAGERGEKEGDPY